MMQSFRFPAEWEKQQSLWTAFPFDTDEWYDKLSAAQAEIAAFVSTLAAHEQRVHLLCRDQNVQTLAKCMIHDINGSTANVEFPIMEYGDIWLRDTGPITLVNDDKKRAQIFAFNGWGEKFLMDGDQSIGHDIAAAQKLRANISHMIFEGGAIDVDGAGNAITTKQCVLNANRNPHMSKEDIEHVIKHSLGIHHICWLDDGLAGDHTDGHVDNLSRFVEIEHVLVPKAEKPDDPNIYIYEDAAKRAQESGFKVSRIISAGRYEIDGEIAPASYMNFVIANDVIIVPQFNISSDAKAIETFSHLFANKKIIGLPSIALLSGGGSFHCASQQLAAN